MRDGTVGNINVENNMINMKPEDANTQTCVECHGVGILFFNRYQFKAYLEFRYSGCAFDKVKEIFNIYRHWKKTDEVICHECDGRG